MSVRTPEKLSIEALFEAEETPLLRYAFGMVARREVAEEIGHLKDSTTKSGGKSNE